MLKLCVSFGGFFRGKGQKGGGGLENDPIIIIKEDGKIIRRVA